MDEVILVLDTDENKIDFIDKVVGAFRINMTGKKLLKYIYNQYEEPLTKLVKGRFVIEIADEKDYFINKNFITKKKVDINNTVPINPEKICLPYLDEIILTDLYS